MQTVVEIHRSAAGDYFDWLQRSGQPPRSSRAVAMSLDEAMREELIRSNGMPATAICNAGTSTPHWIWRFNSNTWIRYVVKDRPTGLFGGISRRVIITEISDTRLS